jgi:hypothetical protein
MVSRALSALARPGLIASAGSLIVLAAGGCSTGGHTTSSGSAKPAATASPRPATASPSPSVTLDGAALSTLLLPASAMPAGWKPYPSGARNGEQALPQDMPQPVPANQVCDMLNTTGWILDGGIDGADFAYSDYWSPSHTAEIFEEIDIFQPGDAGKVMSGLWQAFGHCRSFTEQAAGTTATVAVSRAQLPGVGDQAIKAVSTAQVYYGGTTMAAIRVGDAIMSCLYSSPNSDNGAAAVTMAERLAQQVQAAMHAG